MHEPQLSQVFVSSALTPNTPYLRRLKSRVGYRTSLRKTSIQPRFDFGEKQCELSFVCRGDHLDVGVAGGKQYNKRNRNSFVM